MQNKYKRNMCNVKEALAEPMLGKYNQGKYYKFCALCSYKLIGETRKLKKHCNLYHDSEN